MDGRRFCPNPIHLVTQRQLLNGMASATKAGDMGIDTRSSPTSDWHVREMTSLICRFSLWQRLVCLTSQQHASVSQGRICSDNFTCCHTEIEVADQIFSPTQSQYTDTGPTSPSVDPISPGAWQDSLRSANFQVSGMTRPGKIPAQAGFEPRIFRSRGDALP